MPDPPRCPYTLTRPRSPPRSRPPRPAPQRRPPLPARQAPAPLVRPLADPAPLLVDGPRRPLAVVALAAPAPRQGVLPEEAGAATVTEGERAQPVRHAVL